MTAIDFQTDPSRYRHWRIERDGEVAYLVMDVDPAGGLSDQYELKLNSYDLAVDIELNDAVQRLRFEHPEVRAVVIKSGKDNVFCAGANIRMLGKATHGHKVNFCKFTNETRLAIEDASENSGQIICARSRAMPPAAAMSLRSPPSTSCWSMTAALRSRLPETPLLAVLPGTGGLTRMTDKRKVRRDRADVFCSIEEGIRGDKAVEWRLVDEVVPNSKWSEKVSERAHELAARSDRPRDAPASSSRRSTAASKTTGSPTPTWTSKSTARARLQLSRCTAPRSPLRHRYPRRRRSARHSGRSSVARELEDAILHLRFNEPKIGVLLLRTEGSAQAVLDHDDFLLKANGDWLMREIRHYLKRVFKRIDVTAKSLIALIEPGSCFAGTLAELAFAADRSAMLIGTRAGENRPPAAIVLGRANFGPYPMGNGLTRLQSRFLGEPETLPRAQEKIGTPIEAKEAAELGLVTLSHSKSSTGTTSCASCSKSAPAFPPTRSPPWRRICASPVPRPWRPRSSAGSRPGRTGSSSGPTPSANRARSNSTAAASSRPSKKTGCKP